MTELTIDRAIGRMIKKKFPGCFSWKISDRFHSGLPDRGVIMYGHFIAIEIKKPGEDARPLQKWVLGQIKIAGGSSHVIVSVPEAEKVLLNTKRRLERDGRT